MDSPFAPELRLLYVSRALDGLNDHTVELILRTAETNNARNQITGAVLVYGGRFLQVLEGPAAEVLACFERIRVDPRHHDVQVLQQAPIDHREFGPWAMRHVQADRAREPAVAGFLDNLVRAPGESDVTLALGLLRRLAAPPPPAPAPG